MNSSRDETRHQNMATHSILIFFVQLEQGECFFSVYRKCICTLIIWNGSSNFHAAARTLSRSPSEFRSDDHSLPYMVISCLFPRLPASHRLHCQPVSHWLASCGHRTGRFIGWLPPTRPPPPSPPPVLRQPAERERSLSVDSGCLRLSASSHQQA